MNLGEALTIVLGVNLTDLTVGLNMAKQQVDQYAVKINSVASTIQAKGLSMQTQGWNIMGPAQQQDVANWGVKTEGALGLVASSWGRINQAMGPVRDNMASMLSVANQMSLTAMRTILAGGAMVMAAALPIKEAAEYQKSMSLVKGITQATASEMVGLSNVAIAMSRDTVFSAVQAAEAMQVLARSGLNARDIIAVLPSVMYMAAAGGISISDAAKIATESIHAFNLSAVEFAHFTDVVAKASTSANMGMVEFADAMRYVAPVAKSAGMGVDQTAAALQVLANAGIKGSMGGTTLRQILLRMTDDSKQFKDNFAQMGVKTTDLEGKMRPLLDIMGDLSKANVSLTQAGSIFTARSAAGALALASNIDALRRFTYENQNAAGEAKRLSEVVLNNVIGSLDYLKSSLASLAIAAAGPLLIPFKLLIDLVSGIVNTFEKFSSISVVLNYVMGAVLGVVGAMGGLLLIMGGAGIAISGYIRIVAFLGNSMGYLSGASIKAAADTTALAISFTPLGKALDIVWGKMKLLVATMLLNPYWTIAVAGILVIVAALSHWINQTDIWLEKTKEASDAASTNRKEFTDLAASLGKTSVGTAEHERLIMELIKKYPELAGQLRLTNQTWKEQQQILNDFSTGLMVKELETSFAYAAMLTTKLEELGNEKVRITAIVESPETATSGAYTDDFAAKAQASQATNIADLRAKQAEMRLQWEKWFDSIDWKKLKMPRFDIVKGDLADLDKILSSNDSSVRRITDGWTAQNKTVEGQKEQLLLITAELRKQEEIRNRTVVKPIDIAEFQDAQRALDDVITKFNTEIPKKLKEQIDTSTGLSIGELIGGAGKQMSAAQTQTLQFGAEGFIELPTEDQAKNQINGIISSMATAAAELGPRVTQEMTKQLSALIDEFKKFNANDVASGQELLLRFQTFQTKWNDIIAKLKPLTVGLIGLGGANWNELSTRLGINFAQISNLENLINKSAGVKSGTLTQALAAGLLMSQPGGLGDTGGMIAPISGRMSTHGGFYDTRGGGRQHSSLDLMAPAGTPFVAPTAMKITSASDTMSDAKGGIIWGLDDSGKVWKFVHVNPGVRSGMVQAGQQLGTISDLGGGSHLHLQAKDAAGEAINLQKLAGLQPGSQTELGGTFIGGIPDILDKAKASIDKFKGEPDQLKKGLADFAGDTVPLNIPFDQLKISENAKNLINTVLTNMEKASQDKGVNLYTEIAARKDQANAANTVGVVKNLLESGKMPTPMALVEERKGKAAEYAAAEREQAAKIADLKKSGGADALSPSKILDAENALNTLKKKNALSLAEFDKQASATKAKLTENEVKLRIMAAQNDVESAENVYKIHESDIAAQRATMAAQVEMGTMTGSEAATKNREAENNLYKEQLAILNSKLVLVNLTSDQEQKAIAAKVGSQSQEETSKQYQELALKTEKETNDILTQKAEATNKNVEAMQKLVEEAAKARKEIVGMGIDLLGKVAWGPGQEQAVKLLQNAKEFYDLSSKISSMAIPSQLGPGGLIKPLEADPAMMKMMTEFSDAATILGTPWSQPLAVIVQELVAGVSPERFAAIRNQLQLELLPQVKAQMDFQTKNKAQIDAYVNDISTGVSSIVDALLDGGTNIKTAVNTMFKSLFKDSFMSSTNAMKDTLISGFQKLFSFGKADPYAALSKSGKETANAMTVAASPQVTWLTQIHSVLTQILAKTGLGGTTPGVGGLGGTPTDLGGSGNINTNLPGEGSILPSDQGGPTELGLKDGVTNILSEAGKDAGTKFGTTAQAGMDAGAKSSGGILSSLVKSLFGGGGSGSMGASIGNAIMTGISLVGMLLTKTASAKYTPNTMESGVTKAENVRGLIAGETSIPIAEISGSLAEVFAPATSYLAEILSVLQGMSGLGGAPNQTNNYNLTQENRATTKETMDTYFREYLLKGAKG